MIYTIKKEHIVKNIQGAKFVGKISFVRINCHQYYGPVVAGAIEINGPVMGICKFLAP